MSEKSLKRGFTTGAAAAAAAKAALYLLLSGLQKDKVNIKFLTGEEKEIDIFKVKKNSDSSAECIVIKDAGDDPDITHKAEIGTKVSILEALGASIKIIGGKGVGLVTKKGLELDVGEHAINPGPRQMINESVKDVFLTCNKKQTKNIVIEVFVPKGEELAKKTLNSRLGIMGGISILGTTGIVVPMSHDAYIATIKASIKIAGAAGISDLVYTTGRRSERFAMEIFQDFKEESFVQTGDFFKASIDEALKVKEIETLIFTVFFGKAVKMAMGFEHTHAAKSDLTMRHLAQWAEKICYDKRLVNHIQKANTARHAFSYIHPEFPELINYVGDKIVKNALNFAESKLKIQVIIFDFEGNPVFDSNDSLHS